MSQTKLNRIIGMEVVTAYAHCPRKAFLLYCTEEPALPHEYQVILEERARAGTIRYLNGLQQIHTSISPYCEVDLSSDVDILIDVNLVAANVATYCAALVRVEESR